MCNEISYAAMQSCSQWLLDELSLLLVDLCLADSAGYSWRFNGERHQMTVWYTKTSIFSAFGCCVFGALGNKANVIICCYLDPRHFSIDPKIPYVTLCDLEWPFYVKFCFCAGTSTIFGMDGFFENNFIKTNKDNPYCTYVLRYPDPQHLW